MVLHLACGYGVAYTVCNNAPHEKRRNDTPNSERNDYKRQPNMQEEIQNYTTL